MLANTAVSHTLSAVAKVNPHSGVTEVLLTFWVEMLTFVSQKNLCNKLHELELYEGEKMDLINIMDSCGYIEKKKEKKKNVKAKASSSVP